MRAVFPFVPKCLPCVALQVHMAKRWCLVVASRVARLGVCCRRSAPPADLSARVRIQCVLATQQRTEEASLQVDRAQHGTVSMPQSHTA